MTEVTQLLIEINKLIEDDNNIKEKELEKFKKQLIKFQKIIIENNNEINSDKKKRGRKPMYTEEEKKQITYQRAKEFYEKNKNDKDYMEKKREKDRRRYQIKQLITN
jgi:hypothetical protein